MSGVGTSGPANGTRVVVVGHGMAGARLVSELVDRDPTIRVTVFGDEPHEAYNRILLSNVIAGKAEFDDVTLPSTTSRARGGVELRSGVAVASVDR
nr:FAD-dependent oxidoreductase [Micromonospora sp. DSM 115978]